MGAARAASALRRHAKLLAQVAQGMDAAGNSLANLALGNGLAYADIHVEVSMLVASILRANENVCQLHRMYMFINE